MTMLLAQPPRLSPVQGHFPRDVDCDFHLDFSLDPLPNFPQPHHLDYPESEHELEAVNYSPLSTYSQYSSRLSHPSIRSRHSSRASLPSLPSSSQADLSSSEFWGSFGIAIPAFDQNSDMTAPLNVVKRQHDRGLSDRSGGARSAIYATELTVPGLTAASGPQALEAEAGDIDSDRSFARQSAAPSHCVSVPQSPTASTCDQDFLTTQLPAHQRAGRTISLFVPGKCDGATGDSLEEDVYGSDPPPPVYVETSSDDDARTAREWGTEPPDMRRDSGHSSDGHGPATPHLVPTGLPPTRPPRPPPNLCPPVHGRSLSFWPEEQDEQNGGAISDSGTKFQKLDGTSLCAPPPSSGRVDVRRHSVYSPRMSYSDFSRRGKTSARGEGPSDDGGDNESIGKWRPAAEIANRTRQREMATLASPMKSAFAMRKLSPRPAVGKDEDDDITLLLLSDSDDDDDFSPAAQTYRARSAASRRKSSVPESPSSFDIPAKAASILGLAETVPETTRKTKRGGILGDISGKGLLARRRHATTASSSSGALKAHMRKLSEFDPIGVVKGETREAHIDRNGDLWVNVSAEAKKRPESTKGSTKGSMMSGPPSTKGLSSLPTEVDVAEHVDLYNALKVKAMPPTPESPRSGSFRPRTVTPTTGLSKRGRPGSALFSPLTARSVSQSSTLATPPIDQGHLRTAPRGTLPPPPPSPPSSPLPPLPRLAVSPVPSGRRTHRRTPSNNTLSSVASAQASSLKHVPPKRDTLVPYFPPDEQFVRYVPPSLGRPLSQAPMRPRPMAARKTTQAQSLYETSARIQHPFGAISDATRDELVAALRSGGDLTAEQTALLEASIAALLARPTIPEQDLLAFPVPPPRTSGELLRPENVLGGGPEPPRSSIVPPPRPVRRDTLLRRQSKGLGRSNAPAPIEILTASDLETAEEVEEARIDESPVDPMHVVDEVSEWEPDTPSTKTRFPDFIKRLNGKKETA